jgi:ADP-L-glycero-D-manno-heptose 6-epimerase
MYVITGGAGFIGSVLAAALDATRPGQVVLVADWMGSTDKWRNVAKRNLVDIVRPTDLSAYLAANRSHIEAVLHMGAISDTAERDVDRLMDLNVRYTIDLFNWCAAERVRLITASSAATYGDGRHGYDDRQDLPYLEQLQPLNPYGFSKHLVDKYMVQAESVPPGWVSLKFFNVYGPNEYHKGRMQSVMASAYRQILKDGHVRLFKSYKDGVDDGDQMRDFVYVKDIARVVLWMLQTPQVSGIFNVGTGKARSFNDLARAVFRAMDKRERIEYTEMPDDIRGQYQYHTEANMTKLWHTMDTHGTVPLEFTSLEEGVADYVQNHLMKDDPYL